MKNNTLLNKLLLTLALPALIMACGGDDDGPTLAPIDFESQLSSYNEANGTGTVTIPLRGSADASQYSFEFAGSATEGEDFEVIGVNGEGLQLQILDDGIAEGTELIRVRMVSNSLNLNGNVIHNVAIYSNCDDADAVDVSFFKGDWSATEWYCGVGVTTGSCDYGPYGITFVQDPEDPNHYSVDNFYDGHYHAELIFDAASGTVYFPDQTINGKPLRESAGTFTVNPCDASLSIELDYDGGMWDYTFQKVQ